MDGGERSPKIVKRIWIAALVLVLVAALIVVSRQRAHVPAARPPSSANTPSTANTALTPPDPAATPTLEATRTALGDATSAPTARPRGIAVDERTREPLPDFLVRVFPTGAPAVTATTDARGEFELAAELPAGKLRCDGVDHPDLRRSNPDMRTVNFDPAQPRVELAFAVGPTYFFDLVAPAGVDLSALALEAEISSGRPFSTRPWPSPGNEAPLRAPSTLQRVPDAPWVRFTQRPAWSAPAWLEVRSHDGRWRGGAWSERVEGSGEERVRVELESAAWLVARVVLSGPDAENGATFRLTERLAADATREPRMYGGFAPDGALRIEFVEPGEYVLAARDRRWGPFSRDVTIVRGENDAGTIALEPRPVAGSVRGVIESRTGTYEGACHVSLSRTPFEHDAYFDHSIDFEDDGTGRLVARFELEEVTAGEWFLYVHCHDGFDHPSSLRTITAPADDVKIVLDDAAAAIVIELHDARGKLLDERSELEWRCGEALESESGPRVEITPLPAGLQHFTWLASAPGCKPRRGTAAELERVASSAGGPVQLRGTIVLEPGFGGLVVARERVSHSRVAGVEVFFDDALAGTTDARGELWFTRADRPARVKLSKPGWRWTPTSDADPSTGKLSDGPEFDVELVELR